MDDTNVFFLISIFIIALFIGIFVATLIHNNKLKKAETSAKNIIDSASKEAEQIRKDTLVETKEEINQLKASADREVKEKKQEYLVLEEKLLKREELMDNRDANVQKREIFLEEKERNVKKNEQKVQDLEEEVQKVLDEQLNKLEVLSKLSVDEARSIVLKKYEDKMEREIVSYMIERESEAKQKADRKANEVLANAMQRYASEVTNEITITTVGIPNEDIKGRIIGREGRNIRTFEALTGVDLIIDDTPDVVVLSGFDPIRRETAKRTLEKLIKEGRINPTRIEEVVKTVEREMDTFIIQKGEEVIFELGIGKMHHEIVRLLGCLHFRTSYGQNALQHSKEVAFLSGILAAEIDEDQQLAKRAGLLHDIGKAIDHEAEGSHVELGLEVGRRYKEHKVVLNAIASHHGDAEPNNTISVLVGIADTLSAARPGARSDSLENYIRRLEQLEELTNNFDGVKSAYALQAGREIRVVVDPKQITDEKTYMLAKNIKESIEDNLQYPGTIKVVVIRETRANEEAK